MPWYRVGWGMVALCLAVSIDSHAARSASAVDLKRDGTLAIAGRSLRCGSARNVLDPRLPSLGLAARGVVVLNPRLLTRMASTVRLFVFHHECGHHHVGASEMGADCWAVKQGIRQGWLNREGITQVCRSFGNGPSTQTHPSGNSRCAGLKQCFAEATSARARQAKARATRAAASGGRSAGPELVSGPTFVREGRERSQE